MRDSYGKEVKPGSIVHFGYGSPCVGVWADVIERDGVLVALTPGHRPDECRVKDLKKHVGDFWVVSKRPEGI